MLMIENEKMSFKTKQIWFSEKPFNEQGVDSVAFMDCAEPSKEEGFLCQPVHTLILDLTKGLDYIWSRMHKVNCQKPIKKAEKMGMEVVVDQDHDEFLRIHRNLRRLKGLPKHEYSIDFMQKYGKLFVVKLNDEVLGGEFCLMDENRSHALLGATKRLESSCKKSTMNAANRLLTWEAIKYAHEAGLQEFDLGGYYLGNKPDEQMEKINFYKSGFGGELRTLYNCVRDYTLKMKIARTALKMAQDVKVSLALSAIPSF